MVNLRISCVLHCQRGYHFITPVMFCASHYTGPASQYTGPASHYTGPASHNTGPASLYTGLLSRYRIYHYSGSLQYEQLCPVGTELYSARWLPTPSAALPFTPSAAKIPGVQSAVKTGEQPGVQSAVKTFEQPGVWPARTQSVLSS